MLNLDTHIVVYTTNGTLTAEEKALLDGEVWSISAAVLWELGSVVKLEPQMFDGFISVIPALAGI